MAEINTNTSPDVVNDTLTESRFIMMSGTINTKKSTEVISKLLAYELQGPEDINIVLNSPGGYCNDGFAIYDIMNFITSHVVIVGTGHICSMASLLLCGGKKGKRFLTPNTRIMLHEPSQGQDGTLADLEISLKELQVNKDMLYREIVKNSNLSLEKLLDLTRRDCWISAEQAVEFGLADQILGKYKVPKRKKKAPKVESNDQ